MLRCKVDELCGDIRLLRYIIERLLLGDTPIITPGCRHVYVTGLMGRHGRLRRLRCLRPRGRVIDTHIAAAAAATPARGRAVITTTPPAAWPENGRQPVRRRLATILPF